jgi:hypothetical protein
MVISTTVAPDAAEYSGLSLRFGGPNGSSSSGDAVSLAGDVKNAVFSIELNAPKSPEGVPTPTAPARLQVSLQIRLAAGGSKMLTLSSDALLGLTHATLDGDAATWETVRVPMQNFLKHLDPSEEAESLEGIFVQFSSKPTQAFEIGNVTISDAPVQ